jgi:hypothetical protein
MINPQGAAGNNEQLGTTRASASETKYHSTLPPAPTCVMVHAVRAIHAPFMMVLTYPRPAALRKHHVCEHHGFQWITTAAPFLLLYDVVQFPSGPMARFSSLLWFVSRSFPWFVSLSFPWFVSLLFRMTATALDWKLGTNAQIQPDLSNSWRTRERCRPRKCLNTDGAAPGCRFQRPSIPSSEFRDCILPQLCL